MINLQKGLCRRGVSYYLDYRHETGKRVRKSAGPDLHRALDLVHRLHASDVEDGQATLKSVLDSYLARQRVYSKIKSIRNTESTARRLLAHFGDPCASVMTQAMRDGFVVARRNDVVVDRTLNGDLIVLGAPSNHGVASGLIQQLPFRVKLLKALPCGSSVASDPQYLGGRGRNVEREVPRLRKAVHRSGRWGLAVHRASL